MLRKTLAYLLGTAMLAASVLPAAAQSRMKISAKGAACDQWAAKAFAKGKVPPFSFLYGGTPSADFIAKWDYEARTLPAAEENVAERLYTYTDPATGLQVECRVKCFADFNAMEWVLRFRNTSEANTPVIEQVKVVDLTSDYAAKGEVTLHYASGSDAGRDDFHARVRKLAPGENHYMHPTGGRSSQVGFPFFNVQSPTGGMIVAIGWTGTWYADIACPAAGQSTVATGMKNLAAYLLPGEEIRTPSTAMLLWQGDDFMTGQNIFRRFMLAHHHPRIDGKPAQYPISSSFNYGDPHPCNEYTCLTTDYAVALIRRYEQFGLLPEIFWLDAGWYTQSDDWRNGYNWANTVGNWSVEKKRFPDGLAPIADEAHRVGCKFMVWFEPERAVKGTQWAVEHPEFMLDASGKAVQPDWIKHHDQDSYLFNMGDPEAVDWLCKQVAQLIRDNRIDYYRQDYNIEPEGFWHAHDREGRVGICEIRYIEGLYKFWDYLRAEFPGLLIDNCAGGGRRIDLETSSRSAPMWRTDYNYGEPMGYQCHTYGLSMWLPVHGTGTHQPDPFTFRSSLSATVNFNWKISDANTSIFEMQRCIEEFRAVRPYFYEDFYPMTGEGEKSLTGDDVWLAYQLLRPSDQTGYVVAFRRPEAPEGTCEVRFRGLEPAATYLVEVTDTKECAELSGRELMEGYTICAEPRTSRLIRYSKK